MADPGEVIPVSPDQDLEVPPGGVVRAEPPPVPSQADYDRLVLTQGLAQVRERIAIDTVNWHMTKTGIATEYVDDRGQKRHFHPGEMAKNLLNLIRQEALLTQLLEEGLSRPEEADATEATKLVIPSRDPELRGKAKQAVEEILTGSPPDRAG